MAIYLLCYPAAIEVLEFLISDDYLTCGDNK